MSYDITVTIVGDNLSVEGDVSNLTQKDATRFVEDVLKKLREFEGNQYIELEMALDFVTQCREIQRPLTEQKVFKDRAARLFANTDRDLENLSADDIQIVKNSL